ncbi:uncharacterized protein LOC124641458 [Helicoverpa zea]|uniref:uncharacterized protein LOC124639110 n=1 Tax=Helicoverpa zea TaxID=7113 RepID=UPI001F58D6E2|nr:uncharacterized protein LOC124639110 [Helicoverpa zea]XP_047035480.1 uncharacterized protein LOC124641458 [Helicoverpa zea]
MTDVSPTNKTDTTTLRNVSTTRGNKRQALSSPPQVATEEKLSRDNVRQIIQEVMKTELSQMLLKINESTNNILNRELQPIHEKIAVMTDSMTFMNSQYEDLLKEHAASKEIIKDLQRVNMDMKNNIGDLKERINQLEQQTRSNNIEIQCLPEKKQENLFHIVAALSKVVGCTMEDRDILHCTRVAKLNPKNTRPRSIVVQLASPRIRDQLLASSISFNKNNSENKLNTTHLGYSGPKTAIYIMEHLSSTNKSLHAAARIKAKELGYKYVWVRGGRVFMRKVQESEHILIRNKDILDKLA